MSSERVANLLMALKKKTDLGELHWTETESRAVFQVSFASYSVRLYQDANPFDSDETDIVFQIINDSGDVVEEVRDTELSSWFEKPFVFMRDLYESARRRAMGVDDAIDEIMRSLK